MRKIELFTLKDGIQFENEINEFISRKSIFQIYDIKFLVNIDNDSYHYHAMIYYETKDYAT
jgi:hypothetical protein